MIKMFKFQRTCFRSFRMRPTIIAALLAPFVLMCAIVPLQAATPPTFDIKINRDLAALNGSTTIGNHSGAYIDAQNNRPFLQLTNLDDTPLTTFEMTVADADFFHFAALPQGPIKLINAPDGVNVTSTFLLDGDTLKLELDAGLEKDQSIQFQIRLGADNCPTCGPSYQVALFNICHDAVPMGPPGTLSANGGEASTWDVDYTTRYVDGYYAPPFTSSGVNPPITESNGPDQPVVPEPSGLLLGLIALGGLAQSCTGRRRRTRE